MKKGWKIFAIVAGAVALVYATIALFPRPKNFALDNPMMKEGKLPVLIAHGGGNKEFPDNTLEAFYNAYSVDENVMMETDVSITKDGVVILSHDTDIARKTEFEGEIADWNYTDLMSQEVDFSYHHENKFTNEQGVEVSPLDVEYPTGVQPRHQTKFLATTLEELITAFPNNRINVEIKQEGALGLRALDSVIDLLKKHDAFDRVVVASFHSEIYEEFKRMQKTGEVPKEFMYSPCTDGVVGFYVTFLLGVDVFFGDKMCVFQLPTEQYGFNLATKALVDRAHSHNLAVHYWTINEKDEMRHLIKIGADGIMTDYPHRLAEVYAEYSAV
jgi:glycerophosphoryl diester phosphodiesterase